MSKLADQLRETIRKTLHTQLRTTESGKKLSEFAMNWAMDTCTPEHPMVDTEAWFDNLLGNMAGNVAQLCMGWIDDMIPKPSDPVIAQQVEEYGDQLDRVHLCTKCGRVLVDEIETVCPDGCK